MKIFQGLLVVGCCFLSGVALAKPTAPSQLLSSLHDALQSEDCDADPDMFMEVDAALGDDVRITGYSGYFAVEKSSGRTRKTPISVPNANLPGNEALFDIEVNAQCAIDAGVQTVTLALESVTTDSDGEKTVSQCQLTENVAPGSHTITLNSSYTCN